MKTFSTTHPEIAPVVAQAGEGRVFSLPDQEVRFILSNAQTGHAALAHFSIAPSGGVPLHTHAHEHETWIVTKGVFRFQVGFAEFVVGAGAVVFGPQGIPHSFQNVGQETGEFYLLLSSDNFERFFGAFVAQPGPAAMAEFGITLIEEGKSA